VNLTSNSLNLAFGSSLGKEIFDGVLNELDRARERVDFS